MSITNKDFFYCYDKNLKNYMSGLGFQYITTARSVKNNKQFWLFFVTDELQQEIDNWNERKKENPA